MATAFISPGWPKSRRSIPKILFDCKGVYLMVGTATFFQDNDNLQETATRLIKALGVETAIYICRSNYWHGVQHLIEKQATAFDQQAQDAEAENTTSPARLHSLPQVAIDVDHEPPIADEVAMAA